MRILLTGATGFVGSSVLSALVTSGHDVTAVVRSEDAARAVSAAGATPVIHALPDTEWLTAALREKDGAIHTAVPADGVPEFNDSVIDAVIAAFSGTDKPFVHTGGVWVHGPGQVTEQTPIDAPSIVAWREEGEQRLLGSGVKASLIEPGIVYGYGKGIPTVISGAPRSESGALHLVGDGTQHWTTIHVDDLAALYVDVLEQAPGGERYIGVNGDNPTVIELAQAFVGPDGTVVAETIEESRARLGAAFADALLQSQEATGRKARDVFGWAPKRPTLGEEFAAGYQPS
ncbi:MAG: NAD-dependent dehydratase [Microbacteriaceae bacterium]|nr:NAD-dependent dehydratase [Microbacteriaceae bacterium]